MRGALMFGCLVLGACPEQDPSSIWFRQTDDTDLGTETTTGSLCPADMRQPADVEISVTYLAINGITQTPTIDTSAVLDGTASVCTSDDGKRVQALIYSDGEPMAWWTSGSSKSGALTIGTDGDLVFDAFGHQPPTTFDSSVWTSGTWSIDGGRSTITHTVNAQAAANGQFLVFMGSISVTP